MLFGAAPAARANGPAADPAAEADLAAARALFERNLDAIRRRDPDAYLACYLQSESLARTGPTGFTLGYEDLAGTTATGENWPDAFDAQDLRLVRVQPGVVYGTYRYRVRYGAAEAIGLSERLFVEKPEGWKIAVSTAFEALPGIPPPPRALVGGTLLDGSGGPPVPDAVVVLRDGKVECAGPRAACPVPAGVEATDVAGHWIVPGLIDTHVHLSQTGWADGRPDALDVRDRHPYERVQAELRAHPERLLRSQLCSGVTAVFDVGGYPWTLGLRAEIEPRTDVPRLAAAGPLLSTIDHWLNLPGERQFVPIPDAETARAAVRDLAARGADAVKVWYIVEGPADVAKFEPIVAAAGTEARARDLPLIVHATGLAEAKAALRAGAKLLVHSVWEPIDDEFVQLAKSSGAIYSPTLTVPAGYIAPLRRRRPRRDAGCRRPQRLRRPGDPRQARRDRQLPRRGPRRRHPGGPRAPPRPGRASRPRQPEAPSRRRRPHRPRHRRRQPPHPPRPRHPRRASSHGSRRPNPRPSPGRRHQHRREGPRPRRPRHPDCRQSRRPPSPLRRPHSLYHRLPAPPVGSQRRRAALPRRPPGPGHHASRLTSRHPPPRSLAHARDDNRRSA